jgi:hypothetical protein
MITLDEIEAGDLVQLVDHLGNTAGGTVLLDATRGRLCLRAFGVLLPFAAEGPGGAWRLARGVQLVGHTGSLLRVTDPTPGLTPAAGERPTVALLKPVRPACKSAQELS